MSLPGAKSSDSTSAPDGRAEAIELSPSIRTGDGFELIGLSCLRHVTENEPGVRAGRAESLHQLRVGLRRMRAAISLFKKLLRDRQTQQIKTELRWMTEQLGPARDYQVFLQDVRDLRRRAGSDEPPLRELEELLDEARARALSHACRSIQTERYRHGIDRTMRWLISGDWATSRRRRQRRRRERPLRRFARKLLKRRARKLLDQLRRLPRLDARRRHRLRISVKKLRYGIEFFAGLFPAAARERKRFNADLKRLQDALGRLNDIDVHRQLAPGLLAHAVETSNGRERARFALGVVATREAAEVSGLIRAAVEDSSRLNEHARFWA